MLDALRVGADEGGRVATRGREVTGVAETVISRGRVIIDGGRFTGRAGAGAFLKRSPR
jgi:dihydropyrimidinase